MTEIQLLIVVFQPYALSRMLKIPAKEFTNELMDIDLIFFCLAKELSDRIIATPDIHQSIEILEKYLMSKLQSYQAIDVAIVSSIQLISQQTFPFKISEIASQVNHSLKTLDRRFLEYVGFSPKKYAGIVQVNSYLKSLRDNHDTKLSNLAFNAGYYDYSHAFRDLQLHAGISPNQYNREYLPLALNFLIYTDNNKTII